MKVRVRLFASFAEAAGWREKDMEVGPAASAGDVLALLRKGPLMALPGGARPLLAVNRTHVTAAHPLAEGDEVGVFPPVSGGSTGDPRILVTDRPLEPASFAALVRHASCGAVVTFEGTVRDHSDRTEHVVAMEYEAYPEMAVACLQAIREEIESRHAGTRLALAHRTGRLETGECSVVVACAAPHRREAFAAARLAMDRIKESLPAWKREIGSDGSARWL